MTTTNQQGLIIRDNDGNFYVISSETIEASRVPAERQAELEAALAGDVSGFFFPIFNNQAFQTAVTNVNQGNTANNTNVALGVFGPVNQTALSFQSNAANVGTVQNA